MTDETRVQCFLEDGKEPVWYKGGFIREKLPDPRKEVCLILMTYIILP